MPNSLDENGLQVKTYDELLAEFTAAFESIYGPDINLDSDSPDGQLINIFIQSILDYSDLLVEVYSSMNPDNAIGVTLDQRVGINGIQRQGGTFTTTEIEIATNQSLTLYGLDQAVETVFTVSDDAGNEWNLITTVNIVGPTTASYLFQSAVPGAVLTTPNTINSQVTIVLGVTSVNNPTTYTTLGLDEESDAALKLRRSKSVSLSSQGYKASLLSTLLNINGIVDAFVYENTSDTVDADGVPGHSIWVIVSGSYDNEDVATAIYTKRNAGCGMFGDVSYDITEIDGAIFTVLWDNVENEDLYIRFTASSLDGVNDPDYTSILDQLPQTFVPGVYEQVNINDLATAIQAIDNNTLVTDEGFGTADVGPYTDTLLPSAKDKQFAVAASRIIILPIIVYPKTVTLGSTETQQFTSVGGIAPLVWDMQTSGSGSPMVDSSGFYTAGAGTGTDVVRVTDNLGNVGTATITVV